MNQIALQQTHSPKATIINLSVFTIAHGLARYAMIPEKWRLRHKSSMELARIDKHTLQDIGISDATRFIAMTEPFRGSRA